MINKLVNYFSNILNSVVKWIDKKIDIFIMSDEKLKLFMYMFCFVYLLWTIFILRHDKSLIVFSFLFVIYITIYKNICSKVK